jgi:DnaJ-class molecular chaperone
MTPAERKYRRLVAKADKLRAEESRLMNQRVKAEVEARFLLPKCDECKGRGEVYAYYDEVSGNNQYTYCRECAGTGRVDFSEAK